MHIRKLRNKWQCIVRIKNIALTQSFISKTDARKWGNKQVQTGQVFVAREACRVLI